jgi:CarD family transcriptional regulator
MFNIGDLIIYSSHGICCIDDICEKTYTGVAKNYYVLHPTENSNLEISVPVDSDKVTMLELLNREEAEEIIESFTIPGAA